MHLVITPYKSMGPIRLGMSRDEIHREIGAEYEELYSFDKPAFKGDTTAPGKEHFEDMGIFVDFCRPDMCVAVEVCRPANPMFRGGRLLYTPYGELLSWFKDIDPDVHVESDGLRSRKFGIGLWLLEGHDTLDDFPESAIVFEEGYYEKKYL